MYVMSSLPPHQQSLAGGVFNTVIKLCSAVGLGISASVYNAESMSHAALQTGLKPYKMVFWFCVAVSAMGMCFVPWLTIGTQGGSGASSVVHMDVSPSDGERVGSGKPDKDEKVIGDEAPERGRGKEL